MLRRKRIGFPEGDESNGSSKIVRLAVWRDSRGGRSHVPRQVALAGVPWSPACHVDANRVSRHKHPAVSGDIVQHEPVGRAIDRPLDARERDGTQ